MNDTENIKTNPHITENIQQAFQISKNIRKLIKYVGKTRSSFRER